MVLVSRWLDRARSQSRWLDRRPLWQFALILWAIVTTAGLLGIAFSAIWLHGPMHRGPFFGLVAYSVVTTAFVVWRRQGREDARTVDEWTESRRPPAS